MTHFNMTEIPEAIKQRRPHTDVRLYGNVSCPHCKGRNVHRVRRTTPTGTVTEPHPCPMALVEAVEPVASVAAIQAYLKDNLPEGDELVKLNKARKTKDKELKAFFAGVEHAMAIIKQVNK